MGAPKALLRVGEMTFLEMMLESLRAAGLTGPFAVILGAAHASLAPMVARLGGLPLMNERSEAGRFTSVRLAARWALEGSSLPGRKLLLWPIDCPGVSSATIAGLIAEAGTHPGANIVPTHDGRGGHPVILCGAFLTRLLTEGDGANLRDLMRDGAVPLRFCAVEDPAVLDNVNTPEEYDAFVRARARKEGVRRDASAS